MPISHISTSKSLLMQKRKNKFTLFFILLFISYYKTLAQQTSIYSDLKLMSNQSAANEDVGRYYKSNINDQKIISTTSNKIAKYNPISLSLIGLMWTYQNILSPQLSRSCPYEITCSNFAKKSIIQFGFFKGIIMASDRILRCNKLSILDVYHYDIRTDNGLIDDFPSKYQ